jgi:hypothetical protein
LLAWTLECEVEGVHCAFGASHEWLVLILSPYCTRVRISLKPRNNETHVCKYKFFDASTRQGSRPIADVFSHNAASAHVLMLRVCEEDRYGRRDHGYRDTQAVSRGDQVARTNERVYVDRSSLWSIEMQREDDWPRVFTALSNFRASVFGRIVPGLQGLLSAGKNEPESVRPFP